MNTLHFKTNVQLKNIIGKDLINNDNIEQEQKDLDDLNMIGNEIADDFDDLPFI